MARRRFMGLVVVFWFLVHPHAALQRNPVSCHPSRRLVDTSIAAARHPTPSLGFAGAPVFDLEARRPTRAWVWRGWGGGGGGAPPRGWRRGARCSLDLHPSVPCSRPSLPASVSRFPLSSGARLLCTVLRSTPSCCSRPRAQSFPLLSAVRPPARSLIMAAVLARARIL